MVGAAASPELTPAVRRREWRLVERETLSRPAARTATFLFTDIEGSTRLWEEQRAAMAAALAIHDGLVREAVESSGGTVVKTTGDGMLAVFDQAEGALNAALEGQRALGAAVWPATGPLRVRMAVHSGTAESRDGDFFGPALNRVARLLAIGHGGQILVSGATAVVVADDLPAEAQLLDRGEHHLRDLERPEHVYQLAGRGLPRDFPPLRSAAQRATNLPLATTSFVGRERELAEVDRQLRSSRLLTLVGVGGTGKTRLMLEAAAEAADRYADGVWLVELAPLSDPGLVAQEVGRALGVHEQPSQPAIETVLDFLRSKELLLLLDNCEHLIAAAAEVAETLLGRCPRLTILATSREPLGIAGEAVAAVPSLSLPTAGGVPSSGAAESGSAGAWGDPGGGPGSASADPSVERGWLDEVARSEAVRLFVERAAATSPAFTLESRNAPAVVEICRRLDGIPLALELAAARVNVLSVEEIAQGLGDRFRLLTGGRRTAAPRQQTLQAAIDWSWDLLAQPDRRLLRRLSIFAGGWTLEAAAAVTSDPSAGSDTAGSTAGTAGSTPGRASARFETLDGLSRLVDRSLVAVDHAAGTRYRMLETIRQYAADQLIASGEGTELRERHLDWVERLCQEAQAGLAAGDLTPWLDRLDDELENLRVALDWAFEAHPERAIDMCIAVGSYWRSRSTSSEALERLLQASAVANGLPDPTDPEALQAHRIRVGRIMALTFRQATLRGRSDLVGIGHAAVAAARESGDKAVLGDALASLVQGLSLGHEGDDAALRGVAEEALAVAEGLGEPGRLATVRFAWAILEAPNDPAAANRWLEQGAVDAAKSGDAWLIGASLQARGRTLARLGRYEEAESIFRQGGTELAAIGDARLALSAQSEAAHAMRRAGQLDRAEAEYRQTIGHWQRTGNRGAIAHQLESFGFLAAARGQGERAATLFGAAEALRAAAQAEMMPVERREYEAACELARTSADPAAVDRALAEGRRLDADQAVAFALADLPAEEA